MKQPPKTLPGWNRVRRVVERLGCRHCFTPYSYLKNLGWSVRPPHGISKTESRKRHLSNNYLLYLRLESANTFIRRA